MCAESSNKPVVISIKAFSGQLSLKISSVYENVSDSSCLLRDKVIRLFSQPPKATKHTKYLESINQKSNDDRFWLDAIRSRSGFFFVQTDRECIPEFLTNFVCVVDQPIWVFRLAEYDSRITFGQNVKWKPHQIVLRLHSRHIGQWIQLAVLLVPYLVG